MSLSFMARNSPAALLLGTARYESPQQLTDAIRAAESAVRRRGLRRRYLILEVIRIEAVEPAFGLSMVRRQVPRSIKTCATDTAVLPMSAKEYITARKPDNPARALRRGKDVHLRKAHKRHTEAACGRVPAVSSEAKGNFQIKKQT